MRLLGRHAFGCAICAAIILPSVPAFAGETTIYVYDALGRLVEVRKSGTVNDGVETAIAYDAAGNRTDYDVTGSNGSGSDGGVTGGVGDGSGNGGDSSGGGNDTGGGDGGGDTPPPSPPPPETPPSFSVNSTGVIEGQAIVFTITKTGNVQSSYSVNWFTSDGSAKAGQDYGGASSTLSFAANEASKQVSIATIDDNVVEALETFYLNLNGTSGGATISDPQGAAQITDNDVASNDPPIANNDSVAACGSAFVQVLANDTDPDGDTLTITSVTPQSGPANAVVLGSFISVSNLSSFSIIQYTISDTAGNTANASIFAASNCGGGRLRL